MFLISQVGNEFAVIKLGIGRFKSDRMDSDPKETYKLVMWVRGRRSESGSGALARGGLSGGLWSISATVEG